ncbi:MAG: hypothetical protein IIB00_01935 [candidate division Zixibacteria bacterium]|nr:hypothetical protein [candidate division Zixibacteria bacterium]
MRLIFRSEGVVALLMSLLIVGCGANQKQESHTHDDAETSVRIPETYTAAIEKCGFHLAEIGELIEKGELSKVHKEAAKIRDIARKLPQLAKDNIPVEELKDINIKSKELAGMFTLVDKAADSGDKEGTLHAYEVMQSLVEALKLHSNHDDEHEDH